jgi:hypothetical protein
VLALSLLGAFATAQVAPTKAVYTLLVVLVPLNVCLSMLWAERGARYRASYGWFFFIAAEAVLVWFVFRIPIFRTGRSGPRRSRSSAASPLPRHARPRCGAPGRISSRCRSA